jgi:lipopolysaccharide export system protein LptA
MNFPDLAHGGRRRTAALSILLSLLASSPVNALEEDQQQPVYLEADGVELDEEKSISIYKGSVLIKQGTMEIEADEVTVDHYPDRRPKRIVAIGNPAKYRQKIEGEKEKVEAEAMRMEYDARTEQMTLIDRALLYQGNDTFRSDRIVYDRANARVKAGASARGKERVKILINPSQR